MIEYVKNENRKNLKKVEFTPFDLKNSREAFYMYSNSDYCYYTKRFDLDSGYYCGLPYQTEMYHVGDIDEVIEELEDLFYEEYECLDENDITRWYNETIPWSIKLDIINLEDVKLKGGVPAIRVTLDRLLTPDEINMLSGNPHVVGADCTCRHRYAPEIKQSYFYVK